MALDPTREELPFVEPGEQRGAGLEAMFAALERAGAAAGVKRSVSQTATRAPCSTSVSAQPSPPNPAPTTTQSKRSLTRQGCRAARPRHGSAPVALNETTSALARLRMSRLDRQGEVAQPVCHPARGWLWDASRRTNEPDPRRRSWWGACGRCRPWRGGWAKAIISSSGQGTFAVESGFRVSGAPALRIEAPSTAAGALTFVEGAATWSVRALEVAPRKAEPSAGALVYREVAKDTDFVLHAIPSGIEELRVLRSSRAPHVFRWSVEHGRVRVVDGAVEVRDEHDVLRMRGELPFAVDAKGLRRDLAVHTAGTAVVAELDVSGLQWPIVVDPVWRTVVLGLVWGTTWYSWVTPNANGVLSWAARTSTMGARCSTCPPRSGPCVRSPPRPAPGRARFGCLRSTKRSSSEGRRAAVMATRTPR